ncbi:MAG: ABC transporter permease [Thermoanaerobaculales bacterium]|nr:ABC transporter permease [Thermoanaerobaculales bacterium]
MKRPGRRRLLLTDMRRSWGRLTLAGLGIAVAAAVLTFLVGLGEGVREGVIRRMIPDDRLEVGRQSSHVDLGPLRMALGRDVLDEADLRELGRIPGVKGVFPKVGLAVPATASGGSALLGQTMVTEVVIDGIDPLLVAEDVGAGYSFAARAPVGADALPCWTDADCPSGLYCVDGGGGQRACREPAPVLVASNLVELYNGTVRRAYGLPRLNPEAVLGLTAEVRFGGSSFSGVSRSRVLRDRLRLVGFSNRAAPLGVTLPLEEVRRLNAALGDGSRDGGFDSAVLTLHSPADLGAVAGRVRGMGLQVVNEGAERAAAVMGVAMVAFLLVGGAIVVVAALGVFHTFALLVQGRVREIAVLRAVGASVQDVVLLLLSEAAIVGVAAGAVGVAVGIAVAEITDVAAMQALEQLPFIPESLFLFEPALLLGILAITVFGAVAGALAPIWSVVRRPLAELL